jgi:hypothetical protein
MASLLTQNATQYCAGESWHALNHIVTPLPKRPFVFEQKEDELVGFGIHFRPDLQTVILLIATFHVSHSACWHPIPRHQNRHLPASVPQNATLEIVACCTSSAWIWWATLQVCCRNQLHNKAPQMHLRCMLLVEFDGSPVEEGLAHSPFGTVIHVASPSCFGFVTAAVHHEAHMVAAMGATLLGLVRLDHGGVPVPLEYSLDEWQRNKHIVDAERCDTLCL